MGNISVQARIYSTFSTACRMHAGMEGGSTAV